MKLAIYINQFEEFESQQPMSGIVYVIFILSLENTWTYFLFCVKVVKWGQK